MNSAGLSPKERSPGGGDHSWHGEQETRTETGENCTASMIISQPAHDFAAFRIPKQEIAGSQRLLGHLLPGIEAKRWTSSLTLASHNVCVVIFFFPPCPEDGSLKIAFLVILLFSAAVLCFTDIVEKFDRDPPAGNPATVEQSDSRLMRTPEKNPFVD